MAVRTLQYLLWVTLASATGYSSKCRFPPELEEFFGHPHSEYHHPHYQIPVQRSDSFGQPHADPRSIPVGTSIQRIQEQERQRIVPLQRKEAVRNESPKIVNKYPGFFGVSLRGENERDSVRDGVVFPGPTQSSRNYVPQAIPDECKSQGFCEEIPGYPEEYVALLISQLDRNQYHVEELEKSIEIAQRIGPPDEEELCNFREKIISPRAAPNKDGRWYYILNQPDDPLQSFRVEICSESHGNCSGLALFKIGDEAYCKQKYILRHMSTLDDNGKVVYRQLRLPSCCSCVVKRSR